VIKIFNAKIFDKWMALLLLDSVKLTKHLKFIIMMKKNSP
jgi:hypothetical protein